jgi:hypothetical protein
MKFPSENVSIKGKLDCMHLRDTMYSPDKDGIHQNIPRSDMNLTLPLRPWQWSAMQQCTSYVALHRRPPHTDTPTDSHTNNIWILVAVLHTCTSWITRSMDPPNAAPWRACASWTVGAPPLPTWIPWRWGASWNAVCSSPLPADDPLMCCTQLVLRCVTKLSIFSFRALLRCPFQGPSISWTSGRILEWMVEQELVRHPWQRPANWPPGWHGKDWIKLLIRHRKSESIHTWHSTPFAIQK